MRILVIEDDTKIASAIQKHLKVEGHAVDIAVDGRKGEELAKINEYDVVLLDIMLPGQDGWETCARLRSAGVRTPILMLTALDDVSDKVRGLDSGADDYLVKPFHAEELLARVRSLGRRETTALSAIIEIHGVRLDTRTHHAYRGQQEITLTTKEYMLLELFMKNPDAIITRDRISEYLWDMNFEQRSNLIESFVKLLRLKLDRGFERPLIHTVRGAGYIFTDRQ